MKEKILILEDEIGIRSFVSINLKREGYEVIEAGCGQEAIDKIKNEKNISLALLDVMLPDMSGIEVCKYIRQNFDQVGIIMLTAKAQEEDKIEGFISGADDYMVKPIDMEELLLRVKVLLKRANAANEKKLIIGNLVLDYKQMSVTYKGKNYQLTQKEFLLLYKFLSTPDTIFTRQELIEEIWGLDNESDFRTVDVHIKRIREKLRDIKEFEILTIRGIGYKAIITKNNL